MYLGDVARLAGVWATLDRHGLAVSAVVELELQYLHEIGRLRVQSSEILVSLAETVGLTRADLPLAELVTAARPLGWTRDPFDRLITAHAMAAGADLLTRDVTIRANYARARWA